MEKSKKYPYGSIKVKGKEIPLTKSGLINKTYLPKEVRKKLNEKEKVEKEKEADEWLKEIENYSDK